MPATPGLVVDRDVLERNIAAMAALGESAGVALRPHVKTHKMPQIARMQVDAGARGITVATIAEAEIFADAGFDDLFIAYPLWVDAERGARLAALTQRAAVRIGCDSAAGARMVARHASTMVEVLVEVDSGHHRTGVAPADAGMLGREITGEGLTVAGVFTFPGHSYGPDAREPAAAAERDALRVASISLRENGIDPLIRTGGSSPSMAYLHHSPQDDADTAASTPTRITEMRPGAYVFNDAQQWELGACDQAGIALTAHATVVSHAGRRAVLDAGSKTLAADRAAWATGYGRLLDFPDARLVILSEHHAVAEMNGPLPALGSTVRVVPNHCCNAINYADEVTVLAGGTVVDTWRVAARGANH